MPDRVVFLFVLWVIFLFVIGYFHIHSEKKDKRSIIAVTSCVSLLFVITLGWIWSDHRPRITPKRIAIFPFVEMASFPHGLRWQSLLFSERLALFLRAQNSENTVIYDFNELLKIANHDSLYDMRYLKRLCKKLAVDHLIAGSYSERGDSYALTIEYFDLVRASEPTRVVLVMDRENLPKVGTVLGKELVNPLGFRPHPFEESWTSPEQMENYFKAKLAWLDHSVEEAFGSANASVGDDSSSIASLNLLARVHLRIGHRNTGNKEDAFDNFKAAKELLLRSLSIDSTVTSTHRLLAELFILHEKWNQAEYHLRRGLAHDPLDSSVYLNFAHLHRSRYSDLGFASEEALYLKVLDITPFDGQALVALADLYKLNGRFDLAFEQIRKILQVNPQHIAGLLALGKLYLEQNDLLKVLETYENVAKLDPSNTDIYFNLGVVYYNQRDFDQAIQYFTHALKTDDYVEAHLYLAKIYEMTGDISSAIKHLRRRLAVADKDNPYYEEARKRLFKIMSERGTIDSLSVEDTKSG